jgi:sugar/nucleoside kinase (ribokinase family)
MAGLVVGYLAMTLIAQHDPRYTLPLVVYVAVIATGWLTIGRGRITFAASAVLFVGVWLNIVAGNLGLLGTARIYLPGDSADLIHRGALTFTDTQGYVGGEVRRNPLWDRIFSAMRDEGLRTAHVRLFEAPSRYGVDVDGVFTFAKDYDVDASNAIPEEIADARITTWWTSDEVWVGQYGLSPACGVVEDGIQAPEAAGAPLRVLVERRVGDRFERWCAF